MRSPDLVNVAKSFGAPPYPQPACRLCAKCEMDQWRGCSSIADEANADFEWFILVVPVGDGLRGQGLEHDGDTEYCRRPGDAVLYRNWYITDACQWFFRAVSVVLVIRPYGLLAADLSILARRCDFLSRSAVAVVSTVSSWRRPRSSLRWQWMHLQRSAYSDHLAVCQTFVASSMSIIMAWLSVVITKKNWAIERGFSSCSYHGAHVHLDFSTNVYHRYFHGGVWLSKQPWLFISVQQRKDDGKYLYSV